MYFVFIYENKKMKSVKIVLRRGEGIRENDGGVNLIKIYCKNVCKYRNAAPQTTIICQKNDKKNFTWHPHDTPILSQ
jgi:hypothetical protein